MTYENGSATESELDEEEAECLKLVKKVQLSMNQFRDYLIWQNQNKISIERKKSGWKVEPQTEHNLAQIGLADLLGEREKTVLATKSLVQYSPNSSQEESKESSP